MMKFLTSSSEVDFGLVGAIHIIVEKLIET